MRKKIFLAYMAASSYHVISKEVKITSLDTTEFLDTLVFINNIDKVVEL